MTLNDIQRAALVLFAAREAGPNASVEQMKAICYCVRNRLRAGWHSDWLTVIEHADQAAAHMPQTNYKLEINSRAFQRLACDVDEIFYGQTTPEDRPEAGSANDLEAAIGTQKYWCFLNREMTPWFKQYIARDPENHPVHASMGLMMFYE